MDILDDCISELRKWFLAREGSCRIQQAAPQSEQPEARVTKKRKRTGSSPIILREDTHLELGHPSAGSCSMTLATHDPDLVENGRVTLLGRDIGEASQEVMPFAQIAVACCENNVEDTCSEIDRVLHGASQTDGFMLRSVPDLIWARVSKQAALSGFSILSHGQRLIGALQDECAGIRKSEILFVTRSREDIDELNGIVDPARTRLRKIQTFGRNEDGTYECDTSLDCTECPEKPVCDTIRGVIRIRKGDRIITLGENERGGTA